MSIGSSDCVRVGAWGVILAGLWAPTSAFSQQSQTLAQPDANGLAEIVVTAEKRSERINDVPMSISATTGDQLAKQQITSPEELQNIVPGLTYLKSNFGVPVYTIRGIGFIDSTLAASPAVSIYLDQVGLPYSAMAEGASFDLERVEVLKGPQGTLFGQNSTGGAINYIAAKPTEQPSAGGEPHVRPLQ